jgi:outer membrane lipoprotein-sorting protein
MKVLGTFILLSVSGLCWAQNCSVAVVSEKMTADTNSVQAILRNLNQQTAALKSYQCRLEYRFSQPLLQSQAVRTGALYYLKSDSRSNLRINFQTLQQDEEKQQKYIEQYIFDGVWLTVIDYQIKEVKKYQLAEPNNPADVFELATNNFPVIGFSSTRDLEKDFDILPLPEQRTDSNDLIGLHLKVKPDSIYKNNYSSVDFWIDKKLNLPAKIIALSTEGDIYEIKLLQPKINQQIDKKSFELKIPQGFGKPEVIPLNEKTVKTILQLIIIERGANG